MTSIAKTNFHQGITTPKKKEKKNVGGTIVALLAAGATQNVPKNIFMPKILEGLKKPNLELTEDQIEIVNDGAKKVFNDITNLAKKGVNFNDYQITPYTSVVQTGDFKSDFKAGLSAALEGIFGRTVANGDNAFFIGKSPSWLAEAMENIGFKQNSININMKKLPLASFHEMGHAFNFNNSAVWKTIQKTNKIKILAPLFVMIPALTKEHKAQEGQELTKKQKFVNGLRKACPFLAGATMLPTVLEEGMATLRANNWAKEVFKDTPELAKKVAKGNKWGFISYSMVAILTVLASLVAKKVKDASNKEFSLQINKGTKARKDVEHHQG
jgi:hypothetical protein